MFEFGWLLRTDILHICDQHGISGVMVYKQLWRLILVSSRVSVFECGHSSPCDIVRDGSCCYDPQLPSPCHDHFLYQSEEVKTSTKKERGEDVKTSRKKRKR